MWIHHAVVFHPLAPHLRRECALGHVGSGPLFSVDLSERVEKPLCVVGEFLWWSGLVIVVGDSNQDQNVKPWNLFEIAVTAKLTALPKLFDRWYRVPILFLDVLVGWILGERTVEELAEVLPPLVVLSEVLEQVSLGRFG